MVSGVVEEEEEEEEERRWGGRRSRCPWCNLMGIHCNFCLGFCFFISLKMFLCGTNPSAPVCFAFSTCIVERSMS